MIIGRDIKHQIAIYATKYPILGLTGPRQAGKTTLLQEIFPDYRYISLENPDIREYATTDTIAFLKEYDNKVILDEIQRVPKLFSYLQTKVDKDKVMGQYIISGSQNFKLLKSIQQSLSGRIALFKLFPFDLEELKRENLLGNTALDTLKKGFYPAIFDRNIPSENYYANYLETYIERDVRDLIKLSNYRAFRQFVKLLAHAASQVLNLSSIAKKCRISQPTANAWLEILESSYIVFLLPPYFNNLSKRIIKSPKLYFYDTGLLAFLLGLHASQNIQNLALKGHLFENMVVAEFLKRKAHLNLNMDFYFWRDSNQKEIDLIVEYQNKIALMEIKSTATIQQKLFKNLNDIASYFDKNEVSKYLIYTGEQIQNREIAQIVPWKDISYTKVLTKE